MKLNSIEEVLKDIKRGRMVIMVDDPSRENEGDLIVSAEHATPEKINFMIKHGRGLICVPMEEDVAEELHLRQMSHDPQDPYKTAWAVSVDAEKGVTTGISAHDRSKTIKLLASKKSSAGDFTKPGHVFPLRARRGGVLVRAGHTEACVDLMKLVNKRPVGVICEIMNEDGSMSRLPQLIRFAKKYKLKICTIEDLIRYRRTRERLIEKIAETTLPTPFGEFRMCAYSSMLDDYQHLALIKGDVSSGEVMVRVHSQCLTGDVFHSLRCDCGSQLEKAMKTISDEGKGVILYLSQEGRGIGLFNKLKAYELQDNGLDTVEANEKLGFKADLRDYGIGAQILVDLGLKKIILLTNNPRKVVGLEGYGLHVVKRCSLEIKPVTRNKKYLRTKKNRLGHKLKHV
ncbi:MAG: bifunctional 3,4-dihydroxy-2-butanone-4-phosphate synthase/GTP cyclohydrolase II [Candidatus Omnitrophica bacterium]|nr:bifunctional 3,4-dihydroxy-2-butanone-4-phosphate synthase/GTP cyclohydrolase II [Candidatus Omnitrophota bacterium]MBU1128856.1 bifunctional 3,4-dihydroxy-2-butanone-4-phosphate synthase/GTP cyclohydrolase II [Candidatus Omnitrophota bacterium]MBU1785151.1 bifunctional 3,4-dihydroxy-2-butanone-4-phosphate synthase/GTP cyclohydrolase II [Candidatus Omnitrophota bacterium]MBU1852156.1 bifunctional 3,4-dihydroxy-2-butanone-4-phosphate synthase/GTP cyclohydrolase II [Candidatus Omnitrophota bact